MEKHDVIIQRGDPSQHHSEGIVERFNRMLADRLFTYQYHKELEHPSKSNREWVSRLHNVVQNVQKHQPALYYLDGGPKRSFVFEELQPIHDP